MKSSNNAVLPFWLTCPHPLCLYCARRVDFYKYSTLNTSMRTQLGRICPEVYSWDLMDSTYSPQSLPVSFNL